MRALRIRGVVCLVTLMAASSSQADVVRCPQSPVETNLEVFYSNGMFNTIEEAEHSLGVLRRQVPGALGYPEKAIEFSLALNYSEPAVFQLLEVFKQKMAEAGPRMLLQFITGAVFDIVLPREVTRFVSEHTQGLGFIGDGDLEYQVGLYRHALRAGHNVLVVSHSQGNLYVNAARARVFRAGGAPASQEDNFAIVGVASPSSFVAGPQAAECPSLGCYTTLSNDRVIQGVRLADGETLPANAEDARDTGDMLHHGFPNTYMALRSTREQILSHVRAQVEGFPDLEESVHPGVLSATLQWREGADMDLHVYEEDRASHVFYDRKQGTVGDLDVDSERGGDEVENYFADCENLRAGLYEFGVGYFDGQGAEQVELLLTFGTQSRVFSRTFEAPMGAEADYDPTVLARVRVDEIWPRTFSLELEH